MGDDGAGSAATRYLIGADGMLVAVRIARRLRQRGKGRSLPLSRRRRMSSADIIAGTKLHPPRPEPQRGDLRTIAADFLYLLSLPYMILSLFDYLRAHSSQYAGPYGAISISLLTFLSSAVGLIGEFHLSFKYGSGYKQKPRHYASNIPALLFTLALIAFWGARYLSHLFITHRFVYPLLMLGYLYYHHRQGWRNFFKRCAFRVRRIQRLAKRRIPKS